MASIFKRPADRKKRNAPYWIQYTDHEGKRRTEKGFSDRGLTEQLAAKLENEAMLRRRGLLGPEEGEFGRHRRTPIEEHLLAFEKSLGGKDNTAKHVKLTMTRVRRVVEGCEFATLRDLDAVAVESFLNDLRAEEDLGYRTHNHYVQAIDSFCKWLVAKKRLPANPLLGLPRLNAEVDVRHRRRALSADEVSRLLASARSSGETIQGYDGETRARLYLISYMTGLRRREIGSLTPSSFDLDATPAVMRVEAACSKHRKLDVLPIHPELVALLREWVRGLASDQSLFPRVERKKTWLMVRKDLERVGIAYETEAGIADFHASGRHSYVTGLLRNGASITEAKELARHADVRMTMRYTHIGLDDQARALAGLPMPAPPADDALQMRCIPRDAEGHSSAPADTKELLETLGPETTNPRQGGGCVVGSPELSAADAAGGEWRRRELHPQS